MKKTILLIATLILTVASIQAQDLYLSWDGKTLGETVTVWGEPTANDMDFHAIVHNTTSSPINVKVRRTQIDVVNGTLNYFYWGVLNAPQTDESSQYLIVYADGTSEADDFFGRYSPTSKIGTSIVEYMFYNKDNEDQNVKVTVKYWASPEDIAADAMAGGSISEIYPNPANNTIHMDYEMPASVESAQVRIVNLLGAVVQLVDIERYASQLSIDVSDLDGGVYYYSILINDELYKTKKLVIQK